MRSIGALILVVALTLGVAPADALTLNNRAGDAVDFDTLIGDGRWTLVMLWEIDCVFCEQQKPEIDAFHKRNVDSKARVIGVVLDGLENIDEINKMVKRSPTRFPHFVADRERLGADLLAVSGKELWVTPTYLLYGPDGQFKLSHAGVLKGQMIEDVINPPKRTSTR